MSENVTHTENSVEFTDLESNKAKTPFILLSELIGTFILVFGILLPGALGVNLEASSHVWGSENFWNALDTIFSSIAVKGLWVATLILALVFIFRKWSVNLNPAVTLAEVSLRNDTVGLGIIKIITQFIGAFAGVFAAGAVVGYTSTSAYDALVSNGHWVNDGVNVLESAFGQGFGLDTTHPMFQHIQWDSISEGLSYTQPVSAEELRSTEYAWTWIIFMLIETALTFGLLISVFWGKKISYNVRPFVIWGGVWLILLVGIRFDTIALNPARLMAPAILEKVLMGQDVGMQFSWIYLMGELFAVALFHLFVVRSREDVVLDNANTQVVSHSLTEDNEEVEEKSSKKSKTQKNSKIKETIVEEEEEVELINVAKEKKKEEEKKKTTTSKPKKSTPAKKTNNTSSTKKTTSSPKKETTKTQPTKKSAYKNVNFEDYTIQELRIILKEENISFSSRNNKIELIDIANKNLK